MEARNIPTSFIAVRKTSNEIIKRRNFEAVAIKLFMDHIKANPVIFKRDKKDDATKT